MMKHVQRTAKQLAGLLRRSPAHAVGASLVEQSMRAGACASIEGIPKGDCAITAMCAAKLMMPTQTRLSRAGHTAAPPAAAPCLAG